MSKLAKPARAKLYTSAVRSRASGLFHLALFLQSYLAFSKLQALASTLDSLVTVC